jgi:hypothetical protein
MSGRIAADGNDEDFDKDILLWSYSDAQRLVTQNEVLGKCFE